MSDYKEPKLSSCRKFDDPRGSMSILFEAGAEGDEASAKIIKMSQSHYGVLRGFHIQDRDLRQSKKVVLLHGSVQDVCLEIGSDGAPTGATKEHLIYADRQDSMYVLDIPDNWAHAYLVLSESASLMYICDAGYGSEVVFNPLKWFDSWLLPQAQLKLSQKDREGL